MVDFADMVGTWADKAEADLLAVFQLGTANLISEMSTPVTQGGPLPYRTGNLRRSLWVSTTSMPGVDGTPGVKFNEAQDYTEVVRAARLGDTIYAGFRAPYGPRVNYGFVGEDALGRLYNQGGYGFVEHAELNAQRIFDEAVASIVRG